MKTARLASLALLLASTLAFAESGRQPFQKVVDRVDIQKFLGSWYVIALLPTFIEKDATNGIETYSLDAKGNIRVEYIFHKGSPAGRRSVTHQRGWIIDKEKNSVWEVQPLWPFRLPYLIIDLADDYRYTVIGTNNFNYVWIMARNPALSDEDYQGIVSRLAARGYKISGIKRMRQEW